MNEDSLQHRGQEVWRIQQVKATRIPETPIMGLDQTTSRKSQMSTRISERSRTIHAQLIRALAKEYESQGYYVKADHIGHPNGQPPTINGYVPDLAAYSGGTLQIIAEAETCDTITDSHTREQWSAFSKSPCRFHVIVPESCLQDAKLQASIWGLTVDSWWSLSI